MGLLGIEGGLSYSPMPQQDPGLLPLSMGEPMTKADAMGLLGQAMMQQPQPQAPQMQPRQVTPYTPQKRDPMAAYAPFFASLR
jgi:hypothetical protein